jgi:predicted alpha/beta-hydrolase family hydrolase
LRCSAFGRKHAVLPAAEDIVVLPSAEKAAMSADLITRPEGAFAALALAHGAGAGMAHPFMEAAAAALAEHGIGTLRYEFAYMTAGGRRPDPAPALEGEVRAAVERTAQAFPGLPLFAGGKSMGGRMTSQASARAPLPGVRGLVFLGFPLHPAGQPSIARARHLGDVPVPMLFLQGTRDALADLALLEPARAQLGARATLHVVEGADHGFAVLKRSGRTPAEVLSELAGAAAAFARAILLA